MLRSRRILLAALLGLAAAAPASAEPGVMIVHKYDVLIEGEASYAMHHESPPTELGISTLDHAAEFSWETEMSQLAFYDGRVTGAAGTITGLFVTKATRRVHLANVDPWTSECSGTAADAEANHGLIRPVEGTPPGGGSRMAIQVLSSVEFGLPNCTGTKGPSQIKMMKGPNAETHPFETWFDLPPDAIGQGKIIQLLERKVTGHTECPTGEGGTDRTCSLIWKAKVTFTKTGTDVLPIGEDPSKPAPAPAPPKPAPAPVPAPPKPAPVVTPTPGDALIDEDLLVPLVRSAAVTPSAATVPLTCTTGCSGEAVATPLAKGARAAAKPRALARATFSAAPGKRAVVKLRFDARARRAVRRAGGVRVAITARPRGGGAAVRKSVTLKLKR